MTSLGLPYLLMKKVYKDAFAPHDVSADDPFYLNIKKKSLDLYYATVSCIHSGPFQEVKDLIFLRYRNLNTTRDRI